VNVRSNNQSARDRPPARGGARHRRPCAPSPPGTHRLGQSARPSSRRLGRRGSTRPAGQRARHPDRRAQMLTQIARELERATPQATTSAAGCAACETEQRRRHRRRAGRPDRSGLERGPVSRLHALRALGRLSDRVYAHAKIDIVDDAWLTLGSANLNEHSLFNDTEMNLATRSPGLGRQTRLRLWATSRAATRPGRRRAQASDRGLLEADRPVTADAPASGRATHQPTGAVAGVSNRSKRLLGPLQGLLVDG
jgi:phosphatidylserine/phosphatidylglycerophosphate/cardiolipin synthase-like enzyme